MKIITMLSVAGVTACAATPALAADQAPSTATTPSSQQQCRSERTAMGTTTFAQAYGVPAGSANAFGKCVSKRASATAKAATAAKTSAQKTCTAEEAADKAALAAKYGTGKKGANAFGKCVSGKAKAHEVATVKAQTKADINAAKTCKAARKADATAFTAKWGSKKNAFGKCVSSTAKAAAKAPSA
jgi:DNA-binding protein HU-beta